MQTLSFTETCQTRSRAATLALLTTLFLTIFKLGVGLISHSAGLLSEGIHSFLDSVSALIAFFTVREAGKPADAHHPFGHGKIETLSSFFEALLLVIAAGFMVYEGVQQLLKPRTLEYEWVAIGVMLVSLFLCYLVYRHNLAAASATESSALRVNALHFLSDLMTSLGILLGLLLIKLTGWLAVDSMMAFGIAIYIVGISLEQIKQSLSELTDVQLPEDEVGQIQEVLNAFKNKSIGTHALRTRRSGAVRHVDFHMVTCGRVNVSESHSICDEMESKIHDKFPRSSVNIHVEPCEHEGIHCSHTCYFQARIQLQTRLKKDENSND